MKFSILTATYNSGKTIARSLESVLLQRNVDLECIVIDGGSDDDTLQVVDSFKDSRIKLKSEPDRGIYDALNKGLKIATGDVIGFMHSDDLYSNNHVLESVKRALNKESSFVGAYGDLSYFDGARIGNVTRFWHASHCSPLKMYWGWMPPHPTLFLRKSVYETIGNFRLNIGTAADYDHILRVFMKHWKSIAYLPECLVLMQEGGASGRNIGARVRASFTDIQSWHRNSRWPNPFIMLTKPLSKILQFFDK